MGQSSLIRVPNTTAAPAAKKFIKLMPWWLVRGGGPVVPGAGVPFNSVAPVASATNLSVSGGGVASVTNGTWSNSPTSYTYQWLRDGLPIAGATTNSHALVALDQGHMISCAVAAVNAKGTSQPAPSNALGVVTTLMADEEGRAPEPPHHRSPGEPPPPPLPPGRGARRPAV